MAPVMDMVSGSTQSAPHTSGPGGVNNKAGLATSGTFYESPYGLGEFAPFNYSDQNMVDLEDNLRNKLIGLLLVAARSDVASRRFEVEQAWEAELFERGYQHLLPRRGGGWSLPGENSRWGVTTTSDTSSIFATNTYSRDHDIIVAALSRELPDCIFAPMNPEDAGSVNAADIADDFKDIFIANNDLRLRMTEAAHYLFTDDRVVFLTYYELDGQTYGWNPTSQTAMSAEEVVPEMEDVSGESEESAEPQDTEEVASQPVVEEVTEAPKRTPRIPNGRERLKIYGKLGSKVPIVVDDMKQMPWFQLYDDVDVAVAKATFPWIADKIKPGTCGIGEIELDYIARLNTKLALTGAYVTGDSYVRTCVIQYTWLRPMMFFDISITEEERDQLLELFPDGALVCMAGQEFAFARNESMDEHLYVAHPYPGAGQNRRALGTSLIGPQKRLNNWIDLMDDYFRSTVPKKWMDNDAFNVEALKTDNNRPGGIKPFQRQPGVPVSELIFIEPTPQPQQALPEFIMKFFTDVPQSLCGSVPSLFGAPIGGQVGSEGYAMQRDQALERMGVPWNSLKLAFSNVFKQAVGCASRCRDGKISEFVPGKGVLTIPQDALKGGVLCYANYDSSFPESPSEREGRYVEIVKAAPTNPFCAALLANTHNVGEIMMADKLSRLDIPGARAAQMQMGEIERMMQPDPQTNKFGPRPNPDVQDIMEKIDGIKVGMATDLAAGKELPPGSAQQAQQFEQIMMQKAQSLPPVVSTVLVAQDESENHAVHAANCIEWMESRVGRKMKNGTDDEKMVYANIHLHWQGHKQMLAKLAQENSKMPDPKESISVTIDASKMPPEIQSQIFTKAGMQANAAMFNANKEDDVSRDIAKKSVPEVIKTTHTTATQPPQPPRQLKAV